MKDEHLKAVIWPRDNRADAHGQQAGLHRYVIVGMLVTSEPLPNLDGNEHLIDGAVFGLGDLLSLAPQRAPKLRIGDSTSVLTSLKEL